MYKTPKKLRDYALAYYAKHRKRIRAAMTVRRREAGIPERVTLSDADKLNRTIVCAECGREVTTPALKRRGVRLCLRCVRARYRDRDTARAEQQRYRERVKAAYQRMKRGLKCARCGVSGLRRELDFHHRDPATKKFKISRGLYHVSKAVLTEEMAKCDPLCKVCHVREHGAPGEE